MWGAGRGKRAQEVLVWLTGAAPKSQLPSFYIEFLCQEDAEHLGSVHEESESSMVIMVILHPKHSPCRIVDVKL